MTRRENPPSTTLSRNAARLAIAGAAAWVLVIIAMHILEPEFDPSWRMLSEYELGGYGWLMRLAFFGMGIGCLATFVAIWPYLQARVGRAGALLLAVIGIIGSGAGVFITDPIIAPADALTLAGDLHTICGMTFILGFPIAATLIGPGLAGSRAWVPLRRWLYGLTVLAWIGFLVFAASLVILAYCKSGFGPDVLIGWPNRFMAMAYAAWLMIIAWFAGWRIPAMVADLDSVKLKKVIRK